MESPFSTIFGPILVLWIGALVFYALDRFLQPQDRGVAEAIVLALAVGFALGARSQVGVPVEFGPPLAELGWEGMPPFVIASQTVWLLSVLLLVVALLASLASLGQSTAGRSGRLASLGSALLFLTAGDWATLAMAWVLVDLSLICVLNTGQERRERLGWTATLSIAGAVLLGVTLVLWQRDAIVVWVDLGGAGPVETVVTTGLSPRVAVLLAVTALLRLMPFPLPTWHAVAETDDVRDARPLSQVVLYAIPTLLGAYLWSRLVQWEGTQVVRWSGLLPLWGSLAMLVGALRSWAAQDPSKLIACAHTFGAALVLLGAGLDVPHGWQLALGAASTLGVSTLFVAWTQCQHLDIFDIRSYWRAAPALLAMLSLAGLPFTLGFVGRVAVYWSLFATEQWLALILTLCSEALFLGGLLRVLLELERVPDLDGIEGAARDAEDTWWSAQLPRWIRQVDWQREIGYAAGALLALSIVVFGLGPRVLSTVKLGTWFRLPTLPMWAALLLPAVGAVVLYRARGPLLDLAEDWWPLVQRVISLDWVYRGTETILRHVGSLIWGGTLVVEGAGYMAWVVLVCLMILMFVISR
jgi:formate hydrogenlyase subunit 3/multisubunit Na+/H+ antiporter MnhD subunit